MEEDDDIMLNDIERMVERAPAIEGQGKSPRQVREELEELDEIVQEFTRGRDPRAYNREEGSKGPYRPRRTVDTDQMNEVLMAVMDDHSSKVSKMGSLTEKDIPRLREEWMKSCKDIMSGAPERLPPLREINHHIPLIDERKRYKYHSPRCPDALKPELTEKIARYTRAGWWKPDQVEQAAPMLCVRKKNDKLRTVVDGRQRNENTVKDVTPLPDQDVIRLDVARAKIRSKIDLSDAYEQVRVVPSDVHKTAFATIYGTFVSNVMQQGDCNAPSTFQRAMNSIFREYIGIFLHAYLDDLFVYSNSVQEHQRHLGLVFARLREHEFYLREDKCELFADKVDCLGHMIDEKGLHVDADKMAKIREWNRPRNFNDVQRFLGLVQYLAHFLPDISAYTSPLAGMMLNGTSFSWRPLHEKCFQMIKAICCRTPILRPIEPKKDEPIWVICDASVFGVGAMYGQGETWQTCRPAGFMSKKFTDAQRHYRVFELETLAILEALLKWEDKLLGYRIHVVMDHKALEFFKTQSRLSSRQTRWIDYLARFDFDIRYIKGTLNKVADALSRYYEHDYWTEVPGIQDYVNADVRLDPEHDDLPWERLFEVEEGVVESRVRKTNSAKVYAELRALRERIQDRDAVAARMAAEQEDVQGSLSGEAAEDDPTVFESRARGVDLRERMSHEDTFEADIQRGYAGDPFFQRVIAKMGNNPSFTERDGFIWVRNRGGEDVVCVPSASSTDTTLKTRILEQAHQTVGHYGPERTAEYVKRWYWWPRIYHETEKFCKSCETCAQAKGEYQKPAGKLHPLPIATRPWESVGMDFIGPFPEVQGFNYLWVVICRMSSMVHLIPVNTRTTASQLSTTYMREVVRLHGLPSSIVCDRDPKFTSKWWRELHRIMGTKLLMSTSFHPQTDGATERANRSIGQMFRALIRSDQKDWVEKCPLIEFAINSSVAKATGLAPFDINYGFMPAMMREVKDNEKTPPGVRTFAMNALRNMALAHDALIEARVFQQQYADRKRRTEPKIEVDDFVYLSTKNLAMPKGRASKLVPKYVGPYKVVKAMPSTSNYVLELPPELVRRRVHPRFHVGLLRPHYPNDDALFPNRKKAEPYDFGAPENAEWYVDEIVGHRWKARSLEFLVKWNMGDSTWEPLANCDELEALDAYLTLMNVKEWQELPRRVTTTSRRTR
jgi:hypothetical protein